MIRTLAMDGRSACRRVAGPHRNHDAHAGAAAGRTLDRTFAAEGLYPLPHALQAETGARLRVDPAPVVLDREGEAGLLRRGCVAGLREIDVDAACLGVPDRIGQAFLHAAVDREVDRVAVARLQP